MLVGVGHERNTYIHSVEEVLNVPNRLAVERIPGMKKDQSQGTDPFSLSCY